MPLLSDCIAKPKNNYTLLRLLAAVIVVYGHSFAVAKTPGHVEYFVKYIGGTWAGAIAVNIFFFISGLLVTASYLNRNSFFFYIKARSLRIFPALFVCLLLLVFMLGPLTTNLSISEYFQDQKTWKYLYSNLSLVKIMHYLPGVFTENSNQGVNGPLWTLAAEVRMYLYVAILGLMGILRNITLSNYAFAILAFIGIVFPEYLPLVSDNPKYYHLAAYFATGSFFYVNREKINISGHVVVILILAAVAAHKTDFFLITLGALTCYGIAYLAYIPRIPWPSRMGDYSYGIYIYGWPCQQMVEYWLPDLKPMPNFYLSIILTIPFAVLSWHLIEKKALNLKKKKVPFFQNSEAWLRALIKKNLDRCRGLFSSTPEKTPAEYPGNPG